MSAEVLFRVEPLKLGGRVAVVTLNVEKTLNSLTLNMVDLLFSQLSQWEDDPDIAFVWFEGAGSKAFCAGGDIQALYHDMVQHPGGPCPYCEDFFSREYQLDYLIHTYRKPTIVWAHGIVMGGGLGIASACDYRIGTEKTRIAMPEITIGLIPDAGATWSFMKMSTEFAHFLALTGAQINGRDALLVGFVNYLHANERKDDTFNMLLESVEPSNNGDVTQTRSSIEVVLRTAQPDETFAASQLAKHQCLIEDVMATVLASKQPIANLLGQLDKFADDPWLAKAAATFAAGAPTTAQIIVEQFARANTMNLKQMLIQELTLTSQCSRHLDFAEGVRALLIDKDAKPRWQQAHLGAVPAEWVDDHFVEPWFEGDDAYHPLHHLEDSRMS